MHLIAAIPHSEEGVSDITVGQHVQVSQLVVEPVSDGVRLTAVKFMEFVIMLLTAELAPKAPLALSNHALLNPALVWFLGPSYQGES